MYRIFFSNEKLPYIYPIYHNMEVYVDVNANGKIELSDFYIADKIIRTSKFVFKKCLNRRAVNFLDLINYLNEIKIEYIKCDDSDSTPVHVSKLLHVAERLADKDGKEYALKIYPELNEPLGRRISSYSLGEKFFNTLPLFDIVNSYYRLTETFDHDVYEFSTDFKNLKIRKTTNKLVSQDTNDIFDLINELRVKNDNNFFYSIKQKYGIDLADYITDIDYED